MVLDARGAIATARIHRLQDVAAVIELQQLDVADDVLALGLLGLGVGVVVLHLPVAVTHVRHGVLRTGRTVDRDVSVGRVRVLDDRTVELDVPRVDRAVEDPVLQCRVVRVVVPGPVGRDPDVQVRVTIEEVVPDPALHHVAAGTADQQVADAVGVESDVGLQEAVGVVLSVTRVQHRPEPVDEID